MSRRRLLLCVLGAAWAVSLGVGDISAQVFEGKQLTASTSASTEEVQPGRRVTLFLDVDLRPGMHVYAPGAVGYVPINWTLDSPAVMKAGPVKFPTPAILYLPAIGEKMPVYQRHFRLFRDVALSGPAQTQTQGKASADAHGRLVVRGLLSYQACDDRMCYRSQQLPVQWSFAYSARR